MIKNYTAVLLLLVLGLFCSNNASAQLVANNDYAAIPYQTAAVMMIPNVMQNDTFNGVPVSSQTVTFTPMGSVNDPYVSLENDGSAWFTPTGNSGAGVHTLYYKITEVQNVFADVYGSVTLNIDGCLLPTPQLESTVMPTCSANGSITVNNLPSGTYTINVVRNGVLQSSTVASGTSYTAGNLIGGAYHIGVTQGACASADLKVDFYSNCTLNIDYTAAYNDFNNDGYTSVGDRVDYEFTLTNNSAYDLVAVNVDAPGGSLLHIDGTVIPQMLIGESNNSAYTGYKVISQNDINNGYVSDLVGAFGTYNEGLPMLVDVATFAHFTLNQSDGIKLNAFIDANGNGVQESGEFNFTHGQFNYEINGDGTVHHVSPASGQTHLYESNPANSYDIDYTFDSNYPYYSVTPAAYPNVTIAAGSGVTTYNFPVTIVPHDDLVVSITPYGMGPRPGFPYIVRVNLTNLGTQAASGTLTFEKDVLLTLNSVSIAGWLSNPNGFTYDFINLQPNHNLSFTVTMLVPTIPTVALGDVMTNSVSLAFAGDDVDLSTNTDSLTATVIGSYDPNDKVENHGPQIVQSEFSSNDYLTYTIQFENTGTANAINVNVTDALDNQLDENSVRMLDASHDYVLNRIGNNLNWRFDAIDLPPSEEGLPTGKGFVTFQVKPKPGYAVGDIIPNTAEIFFDFNPAIVTNTFLTEFVQTLGVGEFDSSEMAVYPNPAYNVLNISLKDNPIQNIAITDLIGKVVQSQSGNGNEMKLDVSGLSSGVYFVKIKSGTFQKTVKFVKQ